MPELPDVEGFRRTFARHGRGKRVVRVRGDASIVRNSSIRTIAHALEGKRFEAPGRLGKWLVCRAQGPAVLLHFGMTGDMLWSANRSEPDHPHDRLVFELSDGLLRYRNMRKFGGVWFARDEHAVERILEGLGPDALAVGRRDFSDVLDRRVGLKAVLMDQRRIAGLGNLTVDETLWRARLAPSRTASALSRGEIDRLYRAMRRVLELSSREGFVPSGRSWLTGVRGKAGRCPRCRTSLGRATIAGRTTYWCPSCQT